MKSVLFLAALFACICSAHAAISVDAFDITSSIPKDYKVDPRVAKSFYAYCGGMPASYVHSNLLTNPINKGGKNPFLLPNGMLCSAKRASKAVGGMFDYEIKIRDNTGRERLVMTSMSDKGGAFVIYSGRVDPEGSPKYYLLRVF